MLSVKLSSPKVRTFDREGSPKSVSRCTGALYKGPKMILSLKTVQRKQLKLTERNVQGDKQRRVKRKADLGKAPPE